MTHIAKYQTQPFKTFLSDFFVQAGNQAPQFAAQPAVNIAETKEGFRIEVAAPGLSKEDFSIKVENKHLTISATKTQENTEGGPVYRRREFSFGQFERSFRLPETINTDSVNATLVNGILVVDLLKKPEHQPVVKNIEIA